MQANPQQRVTPPDAPQNLPSSSHAPQRPPSLPGNPQQQQHSRTPSAQSGPSQQQSAAQPPNRPTLRDAVVSILANTANGCLHEVGFQKLQQANISQAQMIETMKAENLALHKERNRLNKLLSKPENEQARQNAELRAQVHQLSSQMQTVQKRNAELEPHFQPPVESPTYGDYHVLWQQYNAALGELSRLKAPLTWHTAPGVPPQSQVIQSQGIATKVGRGPSSAASSSANSSSVQHGRPPVVSDRRASDSAITRVSQGIQAHNGGEQIFQFPLGPPQESTASLHRRHSSVVQTTISHSPQAMQPPNPAYYITPGPSSQVMQSAPQAANGASAPGQQIFPHPQQPNSYYRQVPSQPVRSSKNPAKRPRLQQSESTPPMASLSQAPPPAYAEATNLRSGPPIPNGLAAYPVSRPMAPPSHMIAQPNLPVHRPPDPANAPAMHNVPRSETPDLVGISMSLGITQQPPRVRSALNVSSPASNTSQASAYPTSTPVNESARPSEEPTASGHSSTSPLAHYENVARSSAPSPHVATGLPYQSPTTSIDTQATDAIGAGGATPHEAMTPAPMHQTILEEVSEISAGDHQAVEDVVMDYSHTTDDKISGVGMVADSLPPVDTEFDMEMPLVHDENVDEDDDDDEDDSWADLTDDEAADRRPVMECVSSVFFDAADEERYCRLCNLRVEEKLMDVAPTFSESGMRDLVRHLKEEHPAPWAKLRSRDDSTMTEPTTS